MCALRIVADENMPLVKEFFGDIGEITPLTGRQIQAKDVKDVDLLLVRSVTRVNRELLSGSRVRFVGTATIGFDHVDLDYLQENNIGFARAPGSNATSVVEYVLSALLVLAEQNNINLQNKTVGIVGVGSIGSLLQQRLTQWGINCLCCDPPLAGQGQPGLVSLDELLAHSDIVTIHTPLVLVGEYATLHLFNAARLKQLKKNAILINTARGAVVDNQALLAALNARDDLQVVLDVWEHEPDIETKLVPLLKIATPHIAGSSMEGKTRGTEMIYKAACRYFGLPVRKKLGQFLPEAPLIKMVFSDEADVNSALRTVTHAAYDVRSDDAALRRVVADHHTAIGQGFDRLRKEYPVRREFNTLEVKLKHAQPELVSRLRSFGFKVKES